MKRFHIQFELETPDLLEHNEVKAVVAKIIELCSYPRFKMTLVEAKEVKQEK